MKKDIDKLISEHITVSEKLKSQIENIERASKVITEALKKGNKLLIFGNGGSAADAQHIAGEFVNKFKIDRKPLPALALTTDTSVLTSIGNDSGYEYIFEKQIKALGKKGDIALVLTTSDYNIKEKHSTNLYYGLKAAKENEIKTIGLLSKKSKKITELIDEKIIINSKETPRIQEMHMLVYHIVCEQIEKELVD